MSTNEPSTLTEQRSSPEPPSPRQRAALGYDGEYFDDEYVLLPREGRAARRLLLTVVAVLAAGGILGSVLLVWVSRQITPNEPAGDKIASVVIPRGATLDSIGGILEDSAVIADGNVFAWYARWTGSPPPQAGQYVDFRRSSAMADAAKVLKAGPVPETNTVLTVIPGTWMVDALAKIAETFPGVTVEQLQTALSSGEVTSKYLPPGQTNWEGMLLPETYQISDNSTAQEILQKLVNEFDSTLAELGYDEAETRTGRTAYELITIASLIERETGDPPEERGKIARVIFNRLATDTALGVDAGTYYGLGRRGGTDDPLTKTDLESDSPYNLRRAKGLPPTPIALPSKASLEAAINPLDGPWIYYVLVNADPAIHVFAETSDEFLVAKAECQRKGLC